MRSSGVRNDMRLNFQIICRVFEEIIILTEISLPTNTASEEIKVKFQFQVVGNVGPIPSFGCIEASGFKTVSTEINIALCPHGPQAQACLRP
jgi:hypothetical protein